MTHSSLLNQYINGRHVLTAAVPEWGSRQTLEASGSCSPPPIARSRPHAHLRGVFLDQFITFRNTKRETSRRMWRLGRGVELPLLCGAAKARRDRRVHRQPFKTLSKRHKHQHNLLAAILGRCTGTLNIWHSPLAAVAMDMIAQACNSGYKCCCVLIIVVVIKT